MIGRIKRGLDRVAACQLLAKLFRAKGRRGLTLVTTHALGLEGALLVHLNLAQAGLELAERRAVVERIYAPLLTWLERRPWLRLGLAASGHTLERAAALDPVWLERLAGLAALGRVEFVGCGDTVLHGPLVPAAVNRWNQAMGCETYRRLLGLTPRLALVNAASLSLGLCDAYVDAGYEGLLLAPAHGWCVGALEPSLVRSPTGRELVLLRSRGELARNAAPVPPLESLLAGLASQVARRRPIGAGGRVFLGADELELSVRQHEQSSLEAAAAWLDELNARGLVFASFADFLAPRPKRALDLEPALEVELVQSALAGANARINARCAARARELERVGGTARDWQLLCRAFGCDLRAGRRGARGHRFLSSLTPNEERPAARTVFAEAPLRTRRVERTPKRLALGTDGVRAVLQLHRGLALDALAFVVTGPEPLIGTEPSPLANERVSGQLSLSVPGAPDCTDLLPVDPELDERPAYLAARAHVPTPFGMLAKEVRAYAQRLELRYGLSALERRPAGRLLAGCLQVRAEHLGQDLWLSGACGGPRERRLVPRDAEFLLPGTDGWLVLDDGRAGFELTWWPEETQALVLVSARSTARSRWLRLAFLLSDEEQEQSNAPLADFRFSIRAYRNRR
jgi:hypothetical protein